MINYKILQIMYFHYTRPDFRHNIGTVFRKYKFKIQEVNESSLFVKRLVCSLHMPQTQQNKTASLIERNSSKS